VRLIGGEPLLHPRLLDVIEAVRASGVAALVHVTTNGTRLARMSDDFWAAVDGVRVSVYPGFEPATEERRHCEDMAARHRVALEFRACDEFRAAYSEPGTDDTRLIEGIYRTCAVAHDWRCHTVADGRFFKCPMAYFIPRVLGPSSVDPYEDGIPITGRPVFAAQLRAYLACTTPLASCGRCLGTAGRRFPHTQVRDGWRALQSRPTEVLGDARLLAAATETV
jgi:hypothetical protein